MKSINRTHILMALCLSLGALRCAPDAPHDNPLDPASPQFRNTVAVTGSVVLLRDPRQGIASALVWVSPSGSTALTDAGGSFAFASVPAGTVEFVASKEGFMPDTIREEVRAGPGVTVEFRLDALPLISSMSARTKKIDEYFPGPTYLAVFSADVTDPDGLADLDSVWCTVGNLRMGMAFSPASHLYEATVFSYQLPTNNLHWLVGKEIRIHAADNAGGMAEAGNLYVTRIIEASATTVAPAPSDTVGPSPLLEWTPAPVAFFHTLTLEVVRQDAGTQTPVWSQADVDASLWSYQCPATLAPGSYFWTIAVVDEFGNLCRSKPSAFSVLQR